MQKPSHFSALHERRIQLTKYYCNCLHSLVLFVNPGPPNQGDCLRQLDKRKFRRYSARYKQHSIRHAQINWKILLEFIVADADIEDYGKYH